MDNTADTEIREEELNFAEKAIVISTYGWIRDHPGTEWEPSKTSMYIDQCTNKSLLRQIMQDYPNKVNFLFSNINLFIPNII